MRWMWLVEAVMFVGGSHMLAQELNVNPWKLTIGLALIVLSVTPVRS